MEQRSPIYHLLVRQKPYVTRALTVCMKQPAALESLYTRLVQRDPAKGCIDPEMLGAHTHCDVAAVQLLGLGGGPRAVLLPAFLTHVVDAASLWDPAAEGLVAVAEAVWRDGTWSGTLLWDAAIWTAELLLGSAS